LIHFYKRIHSIKMAANHVSIAVVFGQFPQEWDVKSKVGEMYNLVKGGTPECLYYGWAMNGSRAICREAYSSGQGVIAHMKEVKEKFEEAIAQVGPSNVKIMVMGPAADLDLLRPHLEPKGARMITLDGGALALNPFPKGCADRHIALLVEFTVPAGKMDEFKAGFSKFYTATKNGAGASGCYYYSFGIEGNSVFCREGYKDAESLAKHGADVKGMLDEPMNAAGVTMKINVVGPKAEMDKVRPKLEPKGAVFWELDDGALWK